jgi:hypothetical protein
MEDHLACLTFQFEGAGRTDGYTDATLGAALLVPGYRLAEWSNSDPGLGKILYTAVVVLLQSLQLQHHQSFFLWGYRGLEDIKLKVKVLDKAIDYRPIDQAMGEMKHYSMGNRHTFTLVKMIVLEISLVNLRHGVDWWYSL